MTKRKKSNKPPPILAWSGMLGGSFLALLATLMVLVATGLAVVSTTHQNRFAFNELQELREQANQLDIQWGQLLIEQSTFGVEGRVEQKAREQLDMRVPELGKIVMVSNDQ